MMLSLLVDLALGLRRDHSLLEIIYFLDHGQP